jgi:hypothetical protein
LFDAIDIALKVPEYDTLDHFKEEACENLRRAFDLASPIPAPAA